MTRLTGILFCAASLALTIAVCWLLFPYAARSAADVAYSSDVQGAEMFDDVDIKDFGAVSVLDMMQHYIESPPVAGSGDGKKIRFQGC